MLLWLLLFVVMLSCSVGSTQSRAHIIESEATDLLTMWAAEHVWEKRQEHRQEIPTEPPAPPANDSPTASVKSFASLSSDCWSFASAMENPNKLTSPDFSTLSSQSSMQSLTGQKSPERTSLDSPVLPESPQVHRSPMVERSESHNRRSTPLQNSSCWNSSSTPVSPSMARFSFNTTPSPVTNSDPFAGYKVESQEGLVDEFTRVSRSQSMLSQAV